MCATSAAVVPYAVRDSGNLVPVATPTHAALATFRMDLSRESEQRDGLNPNDRPERELVAWIRVGHVDARSAAA